MCIEEGTHCEMKHRKWWTKKENWFELISTLCGIASFIIACIGMASFNSQFPKDGVDLILCSNVLSTNTTNPNFCYPNFNDPCYATEAKEVYKYKTHSPAYSALKGLFILDAIGVSIFIYKSSTLACVNKCKCCKPCRDCCNKNCETVSLGFDVLAWPIILILTLICVGFASNVKEKDFTKTIQVAWKDYSNNEVTQDLSACLIEEDPCNTYYTLFEFNGVAMPVNITHSSCDLDKDFYSDVKVDLKQSITQGLPILGFTTVSLLLSIYLYYLFRKELKESKQHTIETTIHQVNIPQVLVMTTGPSAPAPPSQYPPPMQYSSPTQYPQYSSAQYPLSSTQYPVPMQYGPAQNTYNYSEYQQFSVPTGSTIQPGGYPSNRN